MNRLRRGVWLSALLTLALPALGEIYSYRDANGNRVFSDRPADAQAKPVQIRPANRMPAPPVAAPPAPSAPPPALQSEPYSRLEVLAPADDAAISENSGQLQVSVRSEPALQAGHQYRVRLDDAAVQTSNATQIELSSLDRGTHRLQVEIVDAQGRVLQRSDSHVFHMLRTSLVQRRRIQPCTTADYGQRPECPLRDKPPPKRDVPFVPFM